MQKTRKPMMMLLVAMAMLLLVAPSAYADGEGAAEDAAEWAASWATYVYDYFGW